MDQKPTRGIPEDRVATILARAAELDRERPDTISVDALRTAAMDAGISPAAVDAALEEYATRGLGEGTRSRRRTRRLPRLRLPRLRLRQRIAALGRALRNGIVRTAKALREPVRLAGMLFILGLTGAAGEGALVIGWAAWLWFAYRLIRDQRPSRRIAPFALALAVMTIGLAFGFGAAEVDEDLIAILFAFAVPLLVLGSLIIKVRLPRRSGSSELTPIG